MSQGDIPWDNREFRMYLLSGVAFWTTITYYAFFRDGGREVTWKDFVNNYLSKGVVRTKAGPWSPGQQLDMRRSESLCLSAFRWIGWRSSTSVT